MGGVGAAATEVGGGTDSIGKAGNGEDGCNLVDGQSIEDSVSGSGSKDNFFSLVMRTSCSSSQVLRTATWP